MYDLRNYTDGTGWGPYLDDGSFKVDWEMVESLMIVLGYNSGLCCKRFQPRFSPPWVKALQGVIPDQTTLRKRNLSGDVFWDEEKSFRERDPYNISGVWSRVRSEFSY